MEAPVGDGVINGQSWDMALGRCTADGMPPLFFGDGGAGREAELYAPGIFMGKFTSDGVSNTWACDDGGAVLVGTLKLGAGAKVAEKSCDDFDSAAEDSSAEAKTDLWTNPGAQSTCAGAVLRGLSFFPGECTGVKPDGTSMKVFLTGSGTPAFVSPSTPPTS